METVATSHHTVIDTVLVQTRFPNLEGLWHECGFVRTFCQNASSGQQSWIGAQVVGHAELRRTYSGCVNPGKLGLLMGRSCATCRTSRTQKGSASSLIQRGFVQQPRIFKKEGGEKIIRGNISWHISSFARKQFRND